MRELQLWDSSEGIDRAFGDIAELAAQCRFRDCTHNSEPGCAVKAAVDDGTLARTRLESYPKLQRELAYLERKQDRRAAAEETRRTKRLTRQMKADRDIGPYY